MFTAVLPTISALSNPGLFLKQRNYEYGAIAIVQIITKILSFSITLFIAIRYESYWALIVGDLTNTGLQSVFSYYIHPHRPKFNTNGVKKQWGFSKWMLARSIVGFTRAKADQVIVGIFFETKLVGTYNVSKELILMPYTQILMPLQPVFLSMFNDSKNSLEGLKSSYTTKFINYASDNSSNDMWFISAEDGNCYTIAWRQMGWSGAIGRLLGCFSTYLLINSIIIRDSCRA